MKGREGAVHPQGSGGPFAGKVLVRRVFRGESSLEGRLVMVEGLGFRCSLRPVTSRL